MSIIFYKSAIVAIIASCFLINFSAASWEDVFKNPKSSVIPLRHWDNKTYYLGTHRPMSWFEAVNFCKHLHMKLASIRSEKENEMIYKFLREAGYGFDYWIGGTKLIDNHKWIWFPYGEEIDYTKWQPGQPDFPEIEKCLQVWQIQQQLLWNDRTCDNQLKFICERINECDLVPVL